MEGIVYRVAQNGVEANLSSPKTHIVAFVDGDKFKGVCEPNYIQLHPPQFLSADYSGIAPRRRISKMDRANR
jgi:hypothetical protein